MTFWERTKFIFSYSTTGIKNFFLKIQPRYMDKLQPNRDLRKINSHPVPFNPNKVKPGKDYFNGNFFTLLIIFFYVLIFQKHITGQKANKTIEFDHFTVSQVFLLLILMILMMVERMLYRARKNTNWENSQNSTHGEWSKHALTFKILLYAGLVVYVHVWIGFVLPARQKIKLSKNPALLIDYLLWVAHFAFAAL